MTGRDTPALREQALFQQDPARKWSKKRRAWRTGRSCWRRLRIAIGELQRASGSHVGRGPAPGGGGGVSFQQATARWNLKSGNKARCP